MYKYEGHQFSFEKDWFIIPEIDKNHKLIRFAAALTNDFFYRAKKFISQPRLSG